MIRSALGAIAAIMVVSSAHAADLSPTELVNRHIGAKGDIDAIVADYEDDAVVLQSGRAVQGKAAIRAQFERMFPKRPAGAPAAPSTMKVTRIWEEGNIGFLTWEAGPVSATEEFVIHNGKIAVQAVFMSNVAPKPAQ